MLQYFSFIIFFSVFFSIVAVYRISLPLKVTLGLALLFRIVATLMFAHTLSSDIYSFLTTGHVLLAKSHVYPAMYFPFIFYLGAGVLILGKYIAPLILLKLIFSLFDVGVTFFIYKLSKNLHSSLLYAINPVMLVIITIHGQMDSMPLFFLLWAIYEVKQQREFVVSILLGIAVAIKPWPLIFLPVFLKKSKNPFLYIMVGIIPALTVLLHSSLVHLPVREIITPIKNYRGIYGIWGIGNIMYSLFPDFWETNIQIFRRFFLVVFGLWSFFNYKKDFLSEFFLVILCFFVFSPLFGVQWISWIIPFLIIFGSKLWFKFHLITIYVSLALLSDITVNPIWYGPVRDVVINILSLFVWLFMCYLLLFYRRSLLNGPLKKFVRNQH